MGRDGVPIPQMTRGDPNAGSWERLRQAAASTLSETSRKTVSPEIPRTTASYMSVPSSDTATCSPVANA